VVLFFCHFPASLKAKTRVSCFRKSFGVFLLFLSLVFLSQAGNHNICKRLTFFSLSHPSLPSFISLSLSVYSLFSYRLDLLPPLPPTAADAAAPLRNLLLKGRRTVAAGLPAVSAVVVTDTESSPAAAAAAAAAAGAGTCQ